MTGRSLTRAEVALAESVFGRAIDYDGVRINNRKFIFFQPRRTAMAPNGSIWLHPKGDLYCEDFCARDLTDQGLFIHEMTHVWQYQSGVNLLIKRHPFCRYDYSLKPGWGLKRYGLEQQAEIVRHYFMVREGYPLIGSPGIEVYRGILPFGGK
ncbi:MAG: vgr related protein [Sphingomonadaceae bacterium]